MSSNIFGNLFGRAPVQQHDDLYDAMANNYGASMHKSIAALQNGGVLGHANALRPNLPIPTPEPKDIPALAISLDVAYDLWAAKHGYDWVNINATRTVPTGAGGGMFVPGGWVDPRGIFGGLGNGNVQVGTPTGTYTVSIAPEPPEPEFDWYTVARRLVHVRALENEGGYYRLVPKEWFK